MSVTHDGSSACERLGHLLHLDPTDAGVRVCVTCGQRFEDQ